MTDREKLINLLNEFGVGFKIEERFLICGEEMQKVEGYSGFFTDFEFDDDGKFIRMGVWK